MSVFTIVERETHTIGHTPDAARRDVVDVEVTFEGTTEVFYRHGDQYLVPCGWCTGGTKVEFGHVFGGVCFQCEGRGFSKVVGVVADVERITRRRVRDRARAQRKADERAAADAAEHAAWTASHPAAAAIAAEILADGDEAEARWGFAYEIARQTGWRALSDKQVDAMVKAYDEAKIEHAAEAERAATQRYLGVEGEKVAVTGTVAVAVPVPVSDHFGNPSSAMLVIVEGEGEHAGVTVKAFGSGKTLWDAEKGQHVTISGTVKKHEERDGVQQTQVTRSKVVAA